MRAELSLSSQTYMAEKRKVAAAAKKNEKEREKEIATVEARFRATNQELHAELQASKAQLELIQKDVNKLPPVMTRQRSQEERASIARGSIARGRLTMSRQSGAFDSNGYLGCK